MYDELISKLYQHHEDFGQGRKQSCFEVAVDCKLAADALGALKDNLTAKDKLIEAQKANAMIQQAKEMERRDEVIKRQKVELDRLMGSADPIHAARGCYCRDCKYAKGIRMTAGKWAAKRPYSFGITCKQFNLFPMKESDFCSHGERKGKIE